jgi:23S rRNA (uridine2552-2'-O)-methyltransferase
MSRFRDRRHRHDRYYKKARKEQFASRAVYKLEALDQRFQLLRPGQRVLDLGCSPGGWLQYCAQQVGPRGHVVGIDRLPLRIALPPHVRVVQGDVTEGDTRVLLGDLEHFDVVLSDMAPDTSGIKFADAVKSVALVRRALDLALQTLVPGGHLVAKVFVGAEFDELLAEVKRSFRRVKMSKPESSRKESVEQYIVARERREPRVSKSPQ